MINYIKNKIHKLTNKIVLRKIDYVLERRFLNGLTEHIDNIVKNQAAKLILEKGKMAIACKNKTELYNYILSNSLIVGDFLEFGVWKGESINYFANNTTELQNQRFYGFDSFEGLPEDWRSGFPQGKFSLDGLTPGDDNKVSYIKGWFNETIPVFINSHSLNTPVFIHIDCDIYSSTVDVFKYVAHLIQKDSYILFDEFFAYPGWEEHEYKAFSEFLELSGFDYEIIAFNNSHEQVLVKIISG
jgi:hypothetical protein